jgi:DME family drug/metabolite transporter
VAIDPSVAGPFPATLAVQAALAAALCWTVSSLLWRRCPTSLSSARLNLLKNLIALGLQWPVLLLFPWQGSQVALAQLALSGVVGIALGDSLYFAALRRIGTRRSLTLDAGGPAVTTAVGVVLLGELPRLSQWIGIGLISAAIVLVARQRPATEPSHPANAASGQRDRLGVCLALGALLCGSAGALLARAALLGGEVHPVQAATLRLGAAALVMLPLLRGMVLRSRGPRPSQRRWPLMVLATLLGTSVGIVLQQIALSGLPGGLAVSLLSTAPVMALPLAHLEGDRPGWAGLVSALLALLGISLVAGVLPP